MPKWWPEVLVLLGGFLLGIWIFGPSDDSPDPAHKSAARDSRSPNSTAPNTWSLPPRVPLAQIEDYPPETARRYAEGVIAISQASEKELEAFWHVLQHEEPTDNILRILVMLRWLELNPERALKIAIETNYERDAWVQWARLDFESALAAAKKSGLGAVRNVLVSHASTDPRRVMELAKAYPAFHLQDALQYGLQKVEGYEAALAHAFDANALRNWARREPRDALAWALAKEDRIKTGRSWEALVAEAFKKDPEYLEQVITGLPEGKTRTTIESYQIRNMAATDPEQALAELKERGLPVTLASAIGRDIATTHPKLSLQLYRELHEQNPSTAAAYGDWITDLLTYNDPSDVAVIAAESQSRALRTIVDRWMWLDRQGVAEWARDRPVAERDIHFARLSNGTKEANHRLRHRDIYTEALGYASQIEDEAQRQRSISDVLRHWRSTTPQRLEEYLQGETSAPEIRQAYRQLPQPSTSDDK